VIPGPASYQRSTRSARSVFQRLGSPTGSGKGNASAWASVPSSSQVPSACRHHVDRVARALVRRRARVAQVVEAAEDVVVMAGREPEGEEVRVRHLAGG
jgi:hypothetical protein